MADGKARKQLHIDNLYLVKKLDEDYQKAFYRLYDYLLEDTKKSDLDKSIIANIALEQCMEGMKAQKKPQLVIPRDLKDYVAKYSKGPVYKEMKKKLRNQDYEKLQVGSIWMVFAIAMVLFFLKNLLTKDYLANYAIDAIVACIAGAIAFQNFKIKRRIIRRYQFGSFYMRVDAATILACVFIKLVSPSNFDITYLLLVISFFITKKKIKPQFEAVI